MKIKNHIKYPVVRVCTLWTAIVSGQLSIEVPTRTNKFGNAITVNGIVAYTGSSICVQPNAHLIASILKITATNGFGVGNHDSSDGKNTGSTSNYAGFGFTGDKK